jgi:signal transduction histidine kinase
MSVRQELAAEASLRTVLPIVFLIPLSWLLLNWIIGRIMIRLKRLEASVARRDATSREPIPIDDVSTEILPFVRSMNDLLAKLRAALEQQRRFVSDAAHELKTPLAALQIQIENLYAVDDMDKLGSRLSDLDAGIKRASTLVGQLLRLARYDAGEHAPIVARVDLTALILDCIAHMAPIVDKKTVDVGISRQEAVTVVGSASDFEILINNVLNNAICYTPSGGAIDVSIVSDEGMAIVEVCDTGPGIEEHILPRIFERFFRVAPQTVEGSGLGLAIAKAAANRNRATLERENRKDRSGLRDRMVV